EPNVARHTTERYLQLIQTNERSAIVELFADDAVVEGYLGPPLHGRDAIRKFYESFHFAPPDDGRPRIRIRSWVTDGKRCVIEADALDPANGEYAPFALDHITVNEEGKFVRLAYYRSPVRELAAQG